MKTTQEKIKVMKACVDGEEIEVLDYNIPGRWIPFIYYSEPIWNWELRDYRIKQQRTHEEIMSNWFKDGNGWHKVDVYTPSNQSSHCYYFYHDWRLKEYFNTLEMAVIPPEGK